MQFQITIQVTGLCSWPAEISLWAGGSPATNTPPPLSLSVSRWVARVYEFQGAGHDCTAAAATAAGGLLSDPGVHKFPL